MWVPAFDKGLDILVKRYPPDREVIEGSYRVGSKRYPVEVDHRTSDEILEARARGREALDRMPPILGRYRVEEIKHEERTSLRFESTRRGGSTSITLLPSEGLTTLQEYATRGGTDQVALEDNEQGPHTYMLNAVAERRVEMEAARTSSVLTFLAPLPLNLYRLVYARESAGLSIKQAQRLLRASYIDFSTITSVVRVGKEDTDVARIEAEGTCSPRIADELHKLYGVRRGWLHEHGPMHRPQSIDRILDMLGSDDARVCKR